jgi:hypothetical protein
MKKQDPLEAAVDRIKELMGGVATNLISIGVELKQAKAIHIGRGTDWKPWLRENFQMSLDRAALLIKIADRFRYKQLDYKLSAGVLEVLAPHYVSKEIEDEVVTENKRLLKEGKKPLSRRKAKLMIKKALRRARGQPEVPEPNLPTPKEARKMAQAEREKGHAVLVLASDNNFYTGATDEEADAHAKKRSRALGLERAKDFIISIDLTPHEIIADTPTWLRWWRNEKALRELREAAAWLTALATAVEKANESK